MSELNGFLRVKQVVKLLSIGKSTWWLWVKQQKAPAGLKLGDRVTVWRAVDIQAFIDKSIKASGEV